MIIQSIEDYDKALGWLELQDELVVDIETTGLKQRSDSIIGIAVSNKEQGFYFAHLNFNPKSEKLEELLSAGQMHHMLKQLRGRKLITFNGAFDLPFIKHFFGIDLIRDLHIDALLLKHTVDEEHPFRLKDIAKKLFGLSAASEQEEMLKSVKANGGSGPNDMYKCDLAIMAKYAVKDCLLTSQITEHYLPKLKQQGLEAFFFKDEVMPLYKEVTIPMEQQGIPVNVKMLERDLTAIKQDISELEDKIQEGISPYTDNFLTWYVNRHYPAKRTGEFGQEVVRYYKLGLPKTKSGKYSLAAKAVGSLVDSDAKQFLLGEGKLHPRDVFQIQMQLVAKEEQRYPFNLSSKHHLKKLFFETLGEKAVSFTDLGNPQVDDSFLDLMAEKYAWAGLLRDYNKLIKIKGAYIERFLSEQEEGVFYPSFFQHRTVSGRYGSDLQQLPRPLEPGQTSDLVLKYNNQIRKYFIAGAGYVFIDADYESLEPHVFAHVSGDERLRDIFRRGDDFYSTIAIQTESLQDVSACKTAENYLGKIDKLRRQKAKAYSLGIPYGMSAYKLHYEIGVSKEEAERLVQQYLSAFPDLSQWMEKSKEQAMLYGMVRSEAGRIRHMPEARRLAAEYGENLLDSLWVWQQFHDNEALYDKMKQKRKRFSNFINNARNFQIQSLATSIVNRAAIAIMRYMRQNNIPGYVCAQIHDQLVVRVPERFGDLMQREVQRIMETNYKISIPLRAPAEQGRDFYEAH